MSALLDGRPAGIDLYYRTDRPIAVTLNWPTGSLADRTFTASLDGTALDVDVDQTGTTMTLSADAATSATFTGPADFELVEVLSGDDAVLAVGRWSPSTKAAYRGDTDRTVVVDSVEVNVDVLPSPAATPVGLIDEAVLTESTSNLTVNAFAGALVPNTIVTVPDVPYATVLRGHAAMIHSTSNAVCALAIVVEGGDITQRVDIGYGYNGTAATNPATAYPEVLIGPNSPGDYQLMVYSFQAGTIRVEASNLQNAWLRVFSA